MVILSVGNTLLFMRSPTLIDCIVNNKDVAPFGATFKDGYKASVVCDAILKSAETKKQIDVKY